MRGTLVLFIVVFVLLAAAFLLWRKYAKNMAGVSAYADGYWDKLREQRREVRFKERLTVNCSVSEERGGISHIFSKDISGEGICLKTPEILPEGSALNLEISMPDSKHVTVSGVVVWVNESQKDAESGQRVFDTGVKFTRVGPRERERLNKYLESLA